MINVKNEGIILEHTDNEFEEEAVLNPACIEVDGILHMYYRAVRKGNFSTIGYAELQNNKVIKRLNKPILFPEHEYEKHGLEDPRIVFLDGIYYLLYTAYDGENARIAYVVSKDLINFEKRGLISAEMTYDLAEDYFRNSEVKEKYILFETFFKDRLGKNVLLWEKDALLFPKKINGNFALVHRVLPGIQISYFKNFSELNGEYWKNYLENLGKEILMDPKFWFESSCIGGGCPPIETKEGWLFIYHAVEDTGFKDKTYHVGAALLDLQNPMKVIGRLEEPLFSPTTEWEKKGDVSNVVFPTGAIVKNKRVFIYYGAADKVIACKSVNLEEILKELLRTQKKEKKEVAKAS